MQCKNLLLETTLFFPDPAELQAKYLFLFIQLCTQGLVLFAQLRHYPRATTRKSAPQSLAKAFESVEYERQPCSPAHHRYKPLVFLFLPPVIIAVTY